MNAIVAGGDGFSALLFAAHSCNPNLVNAFVEEDTLGKEWMGDWCGGTVVTSAAQSGNIDVLEIFLDEENQKSHEYNINQVFVAFDSEQSSQFYTKLLICYL